MNTNNFEIKLIPLTSIEQLKKGTKLRIICKNEEDDQDSITVKKVIKMFDDECDWSLPSSGGKDYEILIDKKKNTYFSFNKFLKGMSWVREVYIVKKTNKKGKENDKINQN